MASPVIIEATEILSKARKKRSQEVQKPPVFIPRCSDTTQTSHTSEGKGRARTPDALEVLRMTEATRVTEATATKTLHYELWTYQR